MTVIAEGLHPTMSRSIEMEKYSGVYGVLLTSSATALRHTELKLSINSLVIFL